MDAQGLAEITVGLIFVIVFGALWWLFSCLLS